MTPEELLYNKLVAEKVKQSLPFIKYFDYLKKIDEENRKFEEEYKKSKGKK